MTDDDDDASSVLINHHDVVELTAWISQQKGREITIKIKQFLVAIP